MGTENHGVTVTLPWHYQAPAASTDALSCHAPSSAPSPPPTVTMSSRLPFGSCVNKVACFFLYVFPMLRKVNERQGATELFSGSADCVSRRRAGQTVHCVPHTGLTGHE